MVERTVFKCTHFHECFVIVNEWDPIVGFHQHGNSTSLGIARMALTLKECVGAEGAKWWTPTQLELRNTKTKC